MLLGRIHRLWHQAGQHIWPWCLVLALPSPESCTHCGLLMFGLICNFSHRAVLIDNPVTKDGAFLHQSAAPPLMSPVHEFLFSSYKQIAETSTDWCGWPAALFPR